MTAPTKSQALSPAARLKPGRPLTLAGIADGAEGLVIADLARAIAAGNAPPAISAAVICRDGAGQVGDDQAFGAVGNAGERQRPAGL